MKCLICGNSKNFIAIHQYNEPDKYEAWMGLYGINRTWIRCMRCGFYMQLRDYDIAKLEKIYQYGYRQKGFRNETIEEAFDRITAIDDNENESRYLWFGMHVTYSDAKQVLDIGSGIGVWPYLLKRADYEVTCVEENELSMDFIYEKLGLKCLHGINNVSDRYDTATLIHVLEHIEEADKFLEKIKSFINPGGFLFVEVPDSSEFGYLPKEHDEFNSCHVAFYDMASLYRVVSGAGFTVIDMHLEKTKQRNLSRVMCLAIN